MPLPSKPLGPNEYRWPPPSVESLTDKKFGAYSQSLLRGCLEEECSLSGLDWEHLAVRHLSAVGWRPAAGLSDAALGLAAQSWADCPDRRTEVELLGPDCHLRPRDEATA